MSKSSEKRQERAAYHEAGHVVMNILLVLPFDAVSMRKKTEEGVQVQDGKEQRVKYIYTDGVIWPEERTETVNKDIFAGKLDLREVLSDMAGPVAESMFVGDIDDMGRFGARLDVQGLVACCRAAISPGLPLEEWKESVIEKHLEKGLSLQALEILEANWACVEAVAQALIKHRSLTYEEAKAIVDKRKGG